MTTQSNPEKNEWAIPVARCVFCGHTDESDLQLTTVDCDLVHKRLVCTGCLGKWEDACREAAYIEAEEEGKSIGELFHMDFHDMTEDERGRVLDWARNASGDDELELPF